jgi:coenzyme F420-reducing hydrogenase delta subunit/NAD-dependent dihydropyrimidine dehydrogenase PreA subunit
MNQITITTEDFADQVRAIPGGEHFDVCYACGTCVSKCMIQQKIEPQYNPRKLIRMVMLGMVEEAFSNPTTWLCSACDLCYSACPQEIHISEVIGAVRTLAIEAGYSSPIETVSVDETTCSGCGICGMACPYEAPTLVKKTINGIEDRVSTVDQNKCRGCGICVAACPLGAISRPGVSNQEIIEQTLFSQVVNGDPRLVVFVCDWCLRAAADVEVLESYPDNVRVVHIPCSGRIDPEMALRALKSGIDGILVCGCKPGECHFIRGTMVSACKMGALSNLLEAMHAGKKRAHFVQIGTLERGRVRREVDAMLEDLRTRKDVH